MQHSTPISYYSGLFGVVGGIVAIALGTFAYFRGRRASKNKAPENNT
jgi:hypothetical protein